MVRRARPLRTTKRSPWRLSEASLGWAVWRSDGMGPLGWGWFPGHDFDNIRPDGVCQIAVFRSRRIAKAATLGIPEWRDTSFRYVVLRVRVVLKPHTGRYTKRGTRR